MSVGRNVTGVSHIPVGVTDMDRSLTFWRDFLGLAVTFDTAEVKSDGPAERRTVILRWNPEKASATSVFVSLTLHLSRRPVGRTAQLGQVGVNHIGFWVDDLDGYLTRARAQSIRIVSEPKSGDERPDYPFGDLYRSARVRTAMVADPDGVIVQLDEWSNRPHS